MTANSVDEITSVRAARRAAKGSGRGVGVRDDKNDAGEAVKDNAIT
jgi:hypothetical protein